MYSRNASGSRVIAARQIYNIIFMCFLLERRYVPYAKWRTKTWAERLESGVLVTNDGDFSHRMQHPSYEVPKTYLAEVAGPLPRTVGRRLQTGVELEDGPAKVDSFKLVDSLPGHSIVEVVLHEGRKHIVRRMLEQVGHPVLSLVRTQVGPITLGSTKSGRWRPLNRDEIGKLYKAAGL